jgi:DNA-binding SARP family transcriptional activator
VTRQVRCVSGCRTSGDAPTAIDSDQWLLDHFEPYGSETVLIRDSAPRGNTMGHTPLARVGLLDGFTLSLGGRGPASTPDLPRAEQRLVAHLSLSGRPARTAIAGQLWPDVPEARAHGSLRSVLWRLHKIAPGLITVTCGSLSLADDVRVDVRELTEWARRAMDPRAPTDGLMADGLLPGDLLPGWYDDWVLLERERLRQLRMHALEALAEKYAAAARYGDAVQAAYAAVRAEPLRESAHRTVVRVHLAEGNVAEAVRAYESFQAMLAHEIGAAPTPQMCRLIDSLPGRRPTAAGSS